MKDKEEKPTREERLKAYEYIREWLNENMECTSGFCSLVKLVNDNYKIDYFPEIIAKSPNFTKGVFWFTSAKERIQVLTKIINKMKEEPLIKPGQQFKIDSIEELKEAYDENHKKWRYSLHKEISDFNNGLMWVVCDNDGVIFVHYKQSCYETIPNPFKKEKECPFMKQPEKAVFYIPTYFDIKNPEEIADREDKEALILEELKALREEVEKLKEYRVFNGKEDLIEVNIPEEKPKESAERLIIEGGSTMEFSISDLLFKEQMLEIKNSFQDMVLHSYINKKEAIKIVNYLKKHFEI